MIKSLFIVDDDPITVKICELVIKNTKFADKITGFNNGQECMQFFINCFDKKDIENNKANIPNLILLDLNMPVMDGWEFLEHFVRKYNNRIPDTKIAILTSSINPNDFMKAQQYDVIIDFLHKPLLTDLVEDLKLHDALKEYFN
ncbi:MAG: response regulator [Chitinophagaceae bacterium]|nr:response regulator [Chitinophagales bacterium]